MTFTEAREAESYARAQRERLAEMIREKEKTAPLYLPDRRKG